MTPDVKVYRTNNLVFSTNTYVARWEKRGRRTQDLKEPALSQMTLFGFLFKQAVNKYQMFKKQLGKSKHRLHHNIEEFLNFLGVMIL